MAKLNEIFVGTIRPFINGSPDKNGLQPVIIIPVAGKCPNKVVLSGTVAANSGFEVGKTYLINVRETNENEYGRNFSYLCLNEVNNTTEIMESIKSLGRAQVIDVLQEVPVESESDEFAK